jgi:hypothetical protein
VPEFARITNGDAIDARNRTIDRISPSPSESDSSESLAEWEAIEAI